MRPAVRAAGGRADDRLDGGAVRVRDRGHPLLGWEDSDTLLLVTAQSGASINVPIQARTLSSVLFSTANPQWSDPRPASTLLAEADIGGSIAPDGHAYAVRGVTNVQEGAAWYVVENSGTARKVSDDGGAQLFWSSDSQGVILIERDPATDVQSVVSVDVTTWKRHPIRTLSPEVGPGVWRAK